MEKSKYLSFNKYPKLYPENVFKPKWMNEISILSEIQTPILAYGMGKSYGDVCLNDEGTIIDTTNLNHLISFDTENGVIECEAGISLKEILDFIVPNGWFLPVTPGTKFITLAGAVTNDVHGKNHHDMGTFGRHVLEFELIRTDKGKIKCSPEENPELFKATIGGLGLTGLITRVKFQCQKIENPFMKVENIKFKNLDEFFDINEDSKERFPYTVSWVDCTTKGRQMGRGIYMRGFHAKNSEVDKEPKVKEGALPFPIEKSFINNFTAKTFNKLFYAKQVRKISTQIVHYEPYFYPLDAIDGWEKAYGSKGFVQHQFVIPFENSRENFKKIFKIIVDSGFASFLTVLKSFGDKESPGMLSFPQPGITLAIDYRMEGKKTLDFLEKIDSIVSEAGGRIYPGKDARMSRENFHEFYPNFEEFIKFKDPKFSSNFYRRIK